MEKCFNKYSGIKRFDIGRGFAETDEFDGNADLVMNADDHAAFGRPVEFREEHAGYGHVFHKNFGLMNGVLAGGRVQDQQYFVRGSGNVLFDDALDLAQLAHEMILGMESSRRIDQEHVRVSRQRGLTRIVGYGAGVGALFMFDDLHVNSLGPNRELFDGGGPKRIAGGKDDGFALVGKVFREFGHARGFSGPVNTGHEDHGWSGLRPPQFPIR